MTAFERILDILNDDTIEDFELIVEFIEQAVSDNASGDERKLQAIELFFDEYADSLEGNPFDNAGYNELIDCYNRV